MPDTTAIRHRVGIAVPKAQVRQALTTIDGLGGWWTSTVEGDPEPGGTLRFFFGGPEARAVIEVLDAGPEDEIRWHCVGGPDEWVGTDLTFALRSEGAETVVLFTHAGWRQPVEFLHHCSTKWGYFLLGMKTALEGGAVVAFPNDMAISSWG